MDFISGKTVSTVLQYGVLIPAMERALRQFSDNLVVQPVRSMVSVEKEGGFLGLMPALCEHEDILATKLVTFFPHNQTRHGVPTHNGIVVVFHTHTGIPRAILDGEEITARRTAAVSAVATKYLAPAAASHLAILGAGVQARSHHRALTAIMPFSQVTVWSRTFDNAVKCAGDIGGTPCHTAEEAVRNADVIVTVTAATTPVLMADWVKPGAHINAVGACRPDWSEVHPELMRSGVLYVDSREAAMVESGDVILAKAEIYAELGEMLLGRKEAQRDKTTIFKSLGMAIEDAVSAKLVLDLLASQEQT